MEYQYCEHKEVDKNIWRNFKKKVKFKFDTATKIILSHAFMFNENGQGKFHFTWQLQFNVLENTTKLFIGVLWTIRKILIEIEEPLLISENQCTP